MVDGKDLWEVTWSANDCFMTISVERTVHAIVKRDFEVMTEVFLYDLRWVVNSD